MHFSGAFHRYSGPVPRFFTRAVTGAPAGIACPWRCVMFSGDRLPDLRADRDGAATRAPWRWAVRDAGGRRRGDHEPPSPGEHSTSRTPETRTTASSGSADRRRATAYPGRPGPARTAGCRAGTGRTPWSWSCLDFVAALSASWIAVSAVREGHRRLPGRGRDAPEFHTVTYLVLPLGWLVVLWGNGSYDRRYLGLGSEEFKRVVRGAA